MLYIYDRYLDGKGSGEFPLQRELISAVAGITAESVSRNLSDFREEGLIETYNGSVRIIDYDKLENIRT